MAKIPISNQGQLDFFNFFEDWLVPEPTPVDKPVVAVKESLDSSPNDARHLLALRLAQRLSEEGGITSKILTEEANRAFGGTQAGGDYLSKDAYDALEAAFNIHLLGTEDATWTALNADEAKLKVVDLTNRIQRLPTQTRRDEEMEEFQQFSTPPALSFVANWVANVKKDDVMAEPSAGTGDLAIWSKMVGATLILNELSPRRQALLGALFPEATIFKENAEQLDNVLPIEFKPTVVVMNPPFSSSAGRIQGQRDTTNGARHLEQALKRLEQGGRLVAIVGNGMAADKPAFASWWKDIQAKYNVRANIGISGREYAKYGTTFDNQILVIDKNGVTTQPILTGKVDSVADLPALLEGIRNDRQHIQSTPDKQASRPNTPPISDTIQSGNGVSGISISADSVRAESAGNGTDSGTALIDSEVSGSTEDSHVPNDGIGAGSGVRDRVIGNAGGSGGGDTRGTSSLTTSNSAASVAVEAKDDLATEFTDSVFANYAPQRLTVQGSKPHPGKLVQSAAMSAVQPPAPSYAPLLPKSVIENGLLSIAQIEAVVYAGQAHSEILPNGSRKGFFIGDGTGVGKGREISGIILDNMLQGRTKAVWVSFNEGLIEDAKRDFAGVGGDPTKIFFQGKTKAGNEITQEEGILFTTYSTLRGGEKKQANDLGQKGGKSRAKQIIDWLGKDFDGVIAFDEAHSMGNAIAIKGKRGVKKPSQQAIAGINLQRELPNARVTYVSATGATEISNLSYADRLGLWGEGTPFADTNAFINGVSKGGIASMELISRDMKAMGMYLARSLSYDGVSYERLEHPLSDLQEDIYNELAGAWQVVLNNVEQALELTQAGKSGPGKSAAMSQFWGAHQRFFNQIVTAMQTPAVIDHIRDQLDAGHAAVIQLVNTNEAAQERIIADATANDAPLEELDFTPRQMLMDYVRNGFPVAAYEETKDDNGNITYVPVRDSEGNQVFDREAIALRDSLLETLHQIRVPENPLDSIINAFGSERVAEVTGRGRRFVQSRDDEGNLRVFEEKRGKNSSRADAETFQADKKDILIFSGAGGTGYSFHADNTAENQRKRIHYILQPGWRADAAVQGFGRTHRTNQAQEPHYVLPTTNLKAQKRFVSSIARRLDQLGALTRGQREATSQGMFTASDNLESQYASTALNNFFRDLYRGTTSLKFHDVTKQMGLNLLDENASLNESNLPAIPQFLNRLLSLKTDMQNQVFGEFEKRLVEAVDYAKQRGLYDVGLQTMTALSIQKTRDDVAYEDKKTGAQTRYVELAVTNEVHYHKWEETKKFRNDNLKEGDLSGWFVSEFGKNKGEVFYLGDIGDRLDSDGKSVRRGIVHTIKKHDYRYIDNADVISRGFDYRSVNGSYQRVTLTRAIDEKEAERLWNEQLANAPKTETKTERMLVGVILPIWDRVEGAETIQRLQTDDGEQLLGRMLGPKSAKQTLKNLGLDSGLSNMTASDLFAAITKGSKAILSNGWEIATAKVNYEDRIELKGRGYLTDAEKRVLKEQGAFIERINWADRVFIPTGENGLGVFERITSSKPVVDLIGKIDKDSDQEENEAVQESATFNPTSSKLDTVVAASENTHKIEVESLPEGWTESQPGGLIASLDPEKGGIIDSEIVSGKWFVIPNNDALTLITDLETRSDAIKALETAVNLLQPEQSSQPDQTDQGIAPIPSEPNSVTEPHAQAPAVFNHLANQEVISMDKTKKPFHETVAEKLIEQLEQGTAPWQRPWNPDEAGGFLPYNPVTGNRYKGINTLHLLSEDRNDNRWMTYKQAGELGGQVRKGEKGTGVQYWKFTDEQTKRDDNGNPVLDEEGNPVKVVVKLERPRVFFATVFNAEQIDGLPPLEKKEVTWDPIERAENILAASGADINHNGGSRAFYRPSTDSIHLPEKGQFPTAENYYATALTELGHWTGHEDRLNRDIAHPFGSEAYAKEELRAEIASMILGEELGIGHDPVQHAAYVGSWIKALRDDPMEIFRAASDAEKIQGFVLGLEQKYFQEQEQENVQVALDGLSTVLAVDIASVLPQSLPRADLSALGPVGQAIAVTRLLSDQVGITADIERLAFNGLTASQIAQDLEDRLTPIADQGLVPFVRQVRASLGIPPLDVAQAFSEWRDTVEARLSSPSVNIDVLPRADVSALGPVGESIDRSRELADRLGLTADIERMVFDGLTDMQISTSLESRLDPITNLALQEQRDPLTAAIYFVRQVQASLGIPPLDDTEAHQSWRTKVAGRLLDHSHSDAEPNSAPLRQWYKDNVKADINEVASVEKTAKAVGVFDGPLAVDIATVLQRSEEWTFDHYQDYEGESLDVALRKEGLNSIQNVVGNIPERFFDTAIETLSPIFGIAPDDISVTNAYFERKGLAQAFQTMADRLVQNQTQQVSSPAIALSKEGVELDRRNLLDLFPELNGPDGKPNGFGISRITLMADGKVVIDSDSKKAIVADTSAQSETGVTHQDIADYFERGYIKTVALSESAKPETTQFEGGVMRVPVVNSTERLLEESVRNIEYAQEVIPEWRGNYAQEQGNGNVRRAIDLIQGGQVDKAIDALWLNVELEHRYGGENSDEFRDAIKVLEEYWRKWQADNGVGPAITPAMKREFDALPRDLSQLSSATFEEYQKAAEVARLEEQAVKNDPNSSDEDIAAAREKRKSADLLATVNSSDFQNKVSEFEQKQSVASLSGQGGDSVRPDQQNTGNDKTFIAVPFREKEEAKVLGAKWDRQHTSWFIPAGVDQSAFSKWLPSEAGEVKVTSVVNSEVGKPTASDKLYLAVPYSERKAAKEAGAKWDAGAKSWYVGQNANMDKLQRWLPDNTKPQQEPAMTPREEFSSLLKDMGFVLSGNHPVMDGLRHRLETVGDKAGEKAGFYVAHLDGHPAGFAQNNRTGEAQKWKSKGYSLSDGEKAELQAQSASKLQARENELKAKQDAVAASIRQLLAIAPPASADHKYLKSKEARPGDLRMVPTDSTMLPPDSAVMIGKTWKESKELRDSHPDKLVFTAGDLLLSAQDVSGVIRSVQSIQENGMKRFAAGGAKQDMFHVVGGNNGVEALARAPAIVIGEGYATADTLSQSLGYPTVAAFDSGNLPHVAKLLRVQFPDKPIIIAGDNDLHQELTEGRNPGKEKAEAAATAVGGVALFPIFAPGEQAYPIDLDPVTPALAKGDGLSDAQKEAISKMKSFTDFNDLATKSVLGWEGVERQITNVVNKIVSDQRERIETRQHQDNVQRLELQQRQKLASRNAVAII